MADDAEVKAIVLVDHIAYGDDAVVSRTLVKQKTGTITLFAFDRGQELSEHTAPFEAVVQVLDGASEWTVGGEVVPVRAGEMLVLPADVPHSVQAVERFKMLLTMIRS